MASEDVLTSYAIDLPALRHRPASTATLLPSVDLSALIAEAGLSADMARVEARLAERTHSRSALIAAAGLHTVRSGGKRLRALLALLAAQLGAYEIGQVLHAAAAAELIHAASLVHDDLVDDAAQRRGHSTVHARWNSNVALMVGDYFFALAAGEMALTPDARIIAIYAQAVQTIVEGELSPVTKVEPLEDALEQYLYKTGAKTAALFEAACKAGMICGRGSDEQVAALGRFGFALGIAFQIIDDVLDFTSDAQTLGKPAGNDLRQGTITLPLIYAIANGASSTLADLLHTPDADPALFDDALQQIERWRGNDDARTLAERYAAQAEAELAMFDHSPAREMLRALCRFVVARAS